MRREYDLYVLYGKCGCQKTKIECEKELLDAKKAYAQNCGCRCKVDPNTGEPYCSCSQTENPYFCKCNTPNPCEEPVCNVCKCNKEVLPIEETAATIQAEIKSQLELPSMKDFNQMIDIEINDSEYEVRTDIVI